MQNWQIQEAKARLSDLVKLSQKAPQGITVHGKPVAVVLSHEAFEQLSLAKGSLVDFMRASPLYGADDIDFERDRSPARGVSL